MESDYRTLWEMLITASDKIHDLQYKLKSLQNRQTLMEQEWEIFEAEHAINNFERSGEGERIKKNIQEIEYKLLPNNRKRIKKYSKGLS